MNAIKTHAWGEIPWHLNTITYYLLYLSITTIIPLAINAAGIFAMHYGDKIFYFVFEEMRRKTQKYWNYFTF